MKHWSFCTVQVMPRACQLVVCTNAPQLVVRKTKSKKRWTDTYNVHFSEAQIQQMTDLVSSVSVNLTSIKMTQLDPRHFECTKIRNTRFDNIASTFEHTFTRRHQGERRYFGSVEPQTRMSWMKSFMSAKFTQTFHHGSHIMHQIKRRSIINM